MGAGVYSPTNSRPIRFLQLILDQSALIITCGIKASDNEQTIVRPVKRDWAVLSKDTPVDISI